MSLIGDGMTADEVAAVRRHIHDTYGDETMSKHSTRQHRAQRDEANAYAKAWRQKASDARRAGNHEDARLNDRQADRNAERARDHQRAIDRDPSQ